MQICRFPGHAGDREGLVSESLLQLPPCSATVWKLVPPVTARRRSDRGACTPPIEIRRSAHRRRRREPRLEGRRTGSRTTLKALPQYLAALNSPVSLQRSRQLLQHISPGLLGYPGGDLQISTTSRTDALRARFTCRNGGSTTVTPLVTGYPDQLILSKMPIVHVVLTSLVSWATYSQVNADAYSATCPAGPSVLGCYKDHDPSFSTPEFVGPRLLTWGVPGCSGWGGCESSNHGRSDCKPWPEGASRFVRTHSVPLLACLTYRCLLVQV